MLTGLFRRGSCSWMLLTNSGPFSTNRKLHLMKKTKIIILKQSKFHRKKKKKNQCVPMDSIGSLLKDKTHPV